MSKILITDHAAKRYRDRVKPLFSLKDATTELERLSGQAPLASGEQIGLRPEDRFLVISDGIYAPIETDKYGDTVITSVLTRGGLSEEQQKNRKRQRKRKRAATRYAAARREPRAYKRERDAYEF